MYFSAFQASIQNAAWGRLRSWWVCDIDSEYGRENRGGGRRSRTGRSPNGGGLAWEAHRAAIEVHNVEV